MLSLERRGNALTQHIDIIYWQLFYIRILRNKFPTFLPLSPFDNYIYLTAFANVMWAFFNLRPVYYVTTAIKRLITTIKTMV